MGMVRGRVVVLGSSVLMVLGMLGGGCVTGSRGLSSEDRERLKAYVLDAMPEDAKKSDINFENRVRLLGYKVEPEVVRPGQEAKLTFYWRAEDAVGDGWLLFTHLHDEVSDKYDNMDWVGPLRENRNNKQILGPERWEKGKVYVDSQTYRMPDWVRGPDLAVLVGLWKGDSRLKIVSGPKDGENRATVLRIKTGLTGNEKPASDLPSITVPKMAAGEKVVIDGKLDEPAWANAVTAGPFVDVGTGRPNPEYPVQGTAKLLWDDTYLYVGFDVKDPQVVGGFDPANKGKDEWTSTGQPKLWMKDTVEIMVDPDGDGDNKDYYEIQVNPQNRVFKTQYDTYNAPKTDPNGPFGHEDWDLKLKSAVVVHGTLDDPSDRDEGYTVEMALPWSAFTKAQHAPPKNTNVWRMNFYAMQNNGGTAWSPILGQGNFHKASRFGRVLWLSEKPAPAASSSVAVPTPAPSPSTAKATATAMPTAPGLAAPGSAAPTAAKR